jgi:hypothetical protein
MFPWVGGELGTGGIEAFIGTPQERSSFALQTRMEAPGNPWGNLFGGGGGTTGGSATKLTLNRIDNPGFEGVGVNAKNQVQANATAQQADFNQWLKSAGQANAANAGDARQESGAIGNIYNGTLQNDLAKQREGYGTQAKTLAQSTADMLAKIRGDYGAGQGGLINQASGDLAAQRTRFNTDVTAGINKEQSDRNDWLRQYESAARGQTDQSIGDASADAKAMMVAGGGAGTGLLNNRMATIRTRANAMLTSDLADKQKGILDAIRAQQAALTDRLGGWERGDIQDISGQRLRLGDALNAQGRADAGWGYDANAGIDRTLYDAGRADTGYLTGLQTANAGLRRNLRNAGLQDLLQPMQLRQGLLRDDLSNMGLAAGIYDATGSTLLDDPTGRFRPQIFTPSRNNRDLPMPGYPDVPPSGYDYYGGGGGGAMGDGRYGEPESRGNGGPNPYYGNGQQNDPYHYYDPNWRQNTTTSRDAAALREYGFKNYGETAPASSGYTPNFYSYEDYANYDGVDRNY